MESINYKNHWNNTYKKHPLSQLGWYEKKAEQTLELIELCNLPKKALLFNAGAGATILIQQLLEKGYQNLIVNDISSVALNELEKSLTIPKTANVQFIVDDLTNPTELKDLDQVDLWNDRAVLHFFTDENQREAYFNLLKSKVKIGGFVILAEFNLEGAKKCSGLEVFNYDTAMLQERLGDDFELLKSFNYTYIQPSGNPREFVYTLFKRTK
ncbi:MAG: class I SAM-dependent methyltransferase [Lutibacter sp.]